MGRSYQKGGGVDGEELSEGGWGRWGGAIRRGVG